jgi:hypothetical protein
MAWVPVLIMVPVFMELPDIVERIDCPPFVLPPMAKAWVARANVAIAATVVNFFICSYLLGVVASARRFSTECAKNN